MSQDTFKLCPRNFIDETGPWSLNIFQGTLLTLMHWIMFGRYYCINSTKYSKNKMTKIWKCILSPLHSQSVVVTFHLCPSSIGAIKGSASQSVVVTFHLCPSSIGAIKGSAVAQFIVARAK